MEQLFPFLLGVIFVTVNGLTQLVFAQTQGFRLKPASIGLLLSAGLGLAFGLVTPITGQSAMIALAGKNEQQSERATAILLSSVGMVLLGITGSLSAAIEFAGAAIMSGMMAGVGLMLAGIGMDFITDKQKGNLAVGSVSLISAFIIHIAFFGSPNVLVYTVAGSVTASTAYFLIFQRKKQVEVTLSSEETDTGKFWTAAYWKTNDWKVVKPKFSFQAILSTLALICLGAGITTSFGQINANMAGGISQNLDMLSLSSGVAGFTSALFGGMPLEPIISGTAAAPWPVLGSSMVLIVLALLLLLGLVTKLCKYIPTQSIAGFLFILGIFATFLPQMRNDGFASDLPVAGVTMAVTALTKNPFVGVIAGILVRAFGHLIGL